MEFEQIRAYAALMKELELTKLELKDGEDTICLERAHAAAAVAAPAMSAAPAPIAAAISEDDGIFIVSSPMVGVFFAAPESEGKPYVQVGDRVKKGDVLCIIEAMKLLNEITAEHDGVIEEICADNKQVVDFGRPLFRIRRAGR
ncbi:MAG: acetyl-CoA carboxylase biotin carboxyl carrier protein [Oscillospiraceae bacterium]|nr:acetyl-CoA carboxylase biotin carboxyl carrier protein [Oscillospiraceae bacterium]